MNHIKLFALAAAAIATMSGAPTARMQHRAPQSQFFGWSGGRRRGGRGWRSKNEQARDDGIPKAFRQYCRRYHGTIA